MFSGDEPKRMCLKPHAVVTETERQVLLSVSSPPHTHDTGFVMHEVGENATLMKHCRTPVMSGWSV